MQVPKSLDPSSLKAKIDLFCKLLNTDESKLRLLKDVSTTPPKYDTISPKISVWVIDDPSLTC